MSAFPLSEQEKSNDTLVSSASAVYLHIDTNKKMMYCGQLLIKLDTSNKFRLMKRALFFGTCSKELGKNYLT